MDKRNTYPKLKKMLEGVNGELNVSELRLLIMMNVGSSERTIQSCLRVMGETGLIKDIGDCKFIVNGK